MCTLNISDLEHVHYSYQILSVYITVCNITAGHWPFSDHFCSSARQFQLWLAILSEQIQEVTFIEILNDHPNKDNVRSKLDFVGQMS